jgi:hypothetical protein
LNDDFTGGETEFPKKDTSVTPQTGRLLIWRNLNEDGTLDYDSLHAGLPVLSGEKNIAIVWVRENSFESNTNLINNTTTMELLPIHCDLGKILADYECSMLANETLQEKENGILFIIVPSGYVGNGNKMYSDMRNLILKNRLIACISLPENTFKRSGTGVNTYLLIIQKKVDPCNISYNIFISRINNIGYNLTKKETPIKYKIVKETGDIIFDHLHNPILDNDLEED